MNLILPAALNSGILTIRKDLVYEGWLSTYLYSYLMQVKNVYVKMGFPNSLNVFRKLLHLKFLWYLLC